MSRLIASFLLLYLAAGAQVSGKWSGTIEFESPDGDGRARPAVLILKQDGNSVTGTGGPNEEEQYPIKNGILDGEKLTFQVDAESGVMHFELKVSGDEIGGQIRRDDDPNRRATLSVKRVAAK